MANTLTISNITGKVLWEFAKTENWGDSTRQSSSFTYSDSLAQGTGADQADLLFVNQTTLAAGATLNLDLAGSLTDVFGATITFARIKTFYFSLLTTTTASSVTIGNHASAAFLGWFSAATDRITVRNGGFFMISAPDATGYAVTATTADIIKILNNDGSNIATYQIAIAGTSA